VVIGARPATVNRRLSALRAFGAACCDLGLAEFNPAARVRWVREQANGPRWLSKTDQMRMQRELELALVGARTEAAKIQALRDQAAALLMLLAGLRVGEVCALEVDDLDLSERRGSVRVRCGKGGKERIVPLNKTARQALQAWLEARPEGGQAVFVGKRGEAMTPSGIQRRIGQLGRRAGVEATPHILRHTFAKRLVDAGISLEKVASLLGHENLNTTRIYVEPSQADLRRAVEALDL
jgi:integrase/recombinase XerC